LRIRVRWPPPRRVVPGGVHGRPRRPSIVTKPPAAASGHLPIAPPPGDKIEPDAPRRSTGAPQQMTDGTLAGPPRRRPPPAAPPPSRPIAALACPPAAADRQLPPPPRRPPPRTPVARPRHTTNRPAMPLRSTPSPGHRTPLPRPPGHAADRKPAHAAPVAPA